MFFALILYIKNIKILMIAYSTYFIVHITRNEIKKNFNWIACKDDDEEISIYLLL
jgi:hypothetical protein